MANIFRQVAAFPLSWQPDYGLDLCYVTPKIVVTSGPSTAYPQRAYRNPLDKLVRFLDDKHGKEWKIWEFRAEGTGYPDKDVYGRVMHFPWPDYQPPPFGLIPLILASIRNWLDEKDDIGTGDNNECNRRIVVMHCRAGMGRSGTMTCAYLISECGWSPSEASARFTERRMRTGFGQAISIQSQLRWIEYVDRWAKNQKVYVERRVEIKEIYIWGLRAGVKVSIKGFTKHGKQIRTFHTFTRKEKSKTGGTGHAILDMRQRTALPDQVFAESGGSVIILKPTTQVILPTSDINLSVERRIKIVDSWKISTATAHVWFNAFFEGNGPENKGQPDDCGVFKIKWDKMDGIKCFHYKGTHALDHVAVIWKACDVVPATLN